MARHVHRMDDFEMASVTQRGDTLRYVWYGPIDGFIYVMLLKCGWRQEHILFVDGEIIGKLVKEV